MLFTIQLCYLKHAMLLRGGTAAASSPLGLTGCHPGWSWMIPSESFSSDLSARWPTPSRRPEPCRLQRAGRRRREDFPERAEERQSEKTTHTSTFDVLSLSGRLVEAQEETQDHTPRKQDSGFTHFAPTHRFQHHTRCHINPQTRCSGHTVWG